MPSDMSNRFYISCPRSRLYRRSSLRNISIHFVAENDGDDCDPWKNINWLIDELEGVQKMVSIFIERFLVLRRSENGRSELH